MNRQKRFRRLFRFCKDIRSQSSKIACPHSIVNDYSNTVFACSYGHRYSRVFFYKEVSKISWHCPFNKPIPLLYLSRPLIPSTWFSETASAGLMELFSFSLAVSVGLTEMWPWSCRPASNWLLCLACLAASEKGAWRLLGLLLCLASSGRWKRLFCRPFCFSAGNLSMAVVTMARPRTRQHFCIKTWICKLQMYSMYCSTVQYTNPFRLNRKAGYQTLSQTIKNQIKSSKKKERYRSFLNS